MDLYIAKKKIKVDFLKFHIRWAHSPPTMGNFTLIPESSTQVMIPHVIYFHFFKMIKFLHIDNMITCNHYLDLLILFNNSICNSFIFYSSLQVIWAYQYWQMDLNLKKQWDTLLTLMQTVFKEELKSYIHSMSPICNPVIDWKSNSSNILADFKLPIEL